MSPSTPQNASPAPDSSGHDDHRNPLGFTDVRAAESPAAPTDVRFGIPLGFAPRRGAGQPVASGSGYRTEISFRRDHSLHTAVRAESAAGGAGAADRPELGSAEIHEFDLDAELTGLTDEVLDEVWYDEPARDVEKVPFYKKEISFGRKRVAAAPAEPVDAHADDRDHVPFYKREIGFGRKKEADAVAETEVTPLVDPVPFYKREIALGRKKETDAIAEEEVSPFDDATPFYKRELSFKRRRPSVGGPDPQSHTGEPESHLAAVPEPSGAALEASETMLLSEDAEAAVPAHQPSAIDPAVLVEPTHLRAEDEPAATVDLAPTAEDIGAGSTEEHLAEPILEEPRSTEPVLEKALVEDTSPTADAKPDPGPPEETSARGPEAGATPSTPRARSLRAGRGGSPRPKKARKPATGKGKRIVGLKIGASQLAAAVIQENAGRQELLQLVRQPIEPGLVVDGEVRDAARLGEVLRAFVEEHDLPRTNVRIGLASNRIGVRTVEIAGIDDAERFDNAVRFKAHEVLPVAFHESVLDYRVVEERPVESGETSKRVLLVVAPRDQVEPYLTACAAAGLRLTGIDLEALGLLRTFVDAHPIGFRGGDDTATVVVSLGHESTTLLVSGGGVCDFTRVFDWGGETLQQAIATELDVELGDAAEILRHLSLAGRGSDLESLSEESRTRANEAIRARLTPFARELVSSLQFYQTQPDSLGIGEIVITGGTAHLAGLTEALHQMIGVTVRFGDPLGRVVSHASIPDALHARIGSMAVPIGLAIEDAPWRAVNLLPPELRQQGRKRPNVLVVAAPVVAFASVAALAFGFVSARGTASDRREELDAVRAQIDALPEPTRATIDPALRGDQVARAQSVALVLGGRLAWEPFFRDLSRALPADVWLQRIVAEAPTAEAALPVALATPDSAPAAPTGITIDGYTYTQADVALLLARLQAIPSIKSVTLRSARREQKGVEGSKVDVVSFSIIADLNGGAQ